MNEEMNVEALLADIKNCLEEPAAEPEAEAAPVEAQSPVQSKPPKKRSFWRRFLVVLGTFFIILLETVLLIAGGLYGVMYVLAKGPSPTAGELFIRSVRETSAAGFLANLFYSEEEINKIISANTSVDYVETDTSLIQIPTTPEDDSNEPTGPVTDAWGFVDEDGDGIIIDKVKGEGYAGYMMIVLDPSRVTMGSVPSSYEVRGYTVEDMVKHYDAVAGINGGGFSDPNGQGNGSIPDTMVVYDGEVYYPEKGSRRGFAGFDSQHILHVGNFSASDIKKRGIQCGVAFGPVLVVNGQAVDASSLGSGTNPRTAIGQRSDGAVLLLVIDGRQISSLGATYTDLVNIFLSYGAVNACNLDGGSSSVMWYQGEYINNSASMRGVRPIPTAFVVLKEGISG